MTRPSFLFFGAGSPWVYALASALADHGHATTAIALYDTHNFRRLRPKWPAGDVPPHFQREQWVLPPGYAGLFAALLAPLLRARILRSLDRLARRGGAQPWVIVPYPWFESFVRGAPAGRLIYYNYDDYPLFRPRRSAKILRQEQILISRAVMTLCASQRQTETLRARCPRKAKSIRHFPHGVVDRFLNTQPDKITRDRTVGYVGNLMDRVDWRLVDEVARRLPDVQFIFVGGLEGSGGGGQSPGWMRVRETALALPNVRRIDKVPQEEVARYYWSFSINWIPYATDHAFNQAACPTKIMDGLASGRPLISTNLPECRLYPEWITIVHNPEEAAMLLRRVLTAPPDVEACRSQVEFARSYRWYRRAEQLCDWLDATCSESTVH